MNDDSERKTEVIKMVNNNGLKEMVKNIGIIAVVVGIALTVYGFIETKADKSEVAVISIQLSEIQQKLVRLETLLEAKK